MFYEFHGNPYKNGIKPSSKKIDNIRIGYRQFVLRAYLTLTCAFTGIYEVFLGHKHFDIGKQPDPFPGTEAVSLTQFDFDTN